MYDLNRFHPVYDQFANIEDDLNVALIKMELDHLHLDDQSEPALIHLPQFILLKTQDGTYEVLKYGSRYFKLHKLDDSASALSIIMTSQLDFFKRFRTDLEICCEAILEDGGDLSDIKESSVELVSRLTHDFKDLSPAACSAVESDFFKAMCTVLDLRRVASS